jgi:PPOX class probable F420-dependent enzyme
VRRKDDPIRSEHPSSGAGRIPGARPAGARPGAHPVPGRRLPGAVAVARLAARGAPSGARLISTAPRSGSLADFGSCRCTLLVSYRRDGTPVPTPVWAAPAGGALFVRSERASGKVKRLHGDARVLIAPCTAGGRPLGEPLEASAAVLGPEEELLAERILAGRYGFGRALFERAMDLMRVDMCYLKLTPGRWS